MTLWLSQVVIHARAFHLDVLDGVYNDFRDQDGFNLECREGALMSFDGKTLISSDPDRTREPRLLAEP